MATPKLKDRIAKVLSDHGAAVSFQDLAWEVYKDSETAWRSASHGGPPGCYMTLSATIRRNRFSDYRDRHGRRMIGWGKFE